MIEPNLHGLSVTRQSALLSISQSSFYDDRLAKIVPCRPEEIRLSLGCPSAT